MRFVLAVVCALSWAGCAITSPVGSLMNVPKESATECVTHCGTLDMRMTGVVIIKNAIGCVCEPKDAQMKVSHGAVSAAVGGALISEEEEAAAAARSRGPHR